MNRIKILITIPLALLTLTVCTPFIEDIEPSDALPSDQAYQTIGDLEVAVIGVYDAAQNWASLGFGLVSFPDLMAGNTEWRGADVDIQDVANFTMNAQNYIPRITWRDVYTQINLANRILEALDEITVSQQDAAQADQIRGEALALRAVSHFELVRLFAKPYDEMAESNPGIPLMTRSTTTTDELTFPARASVADVYQQVIADLSAATQLLPEQVARGRINRYAALTALAEVSFQMSAYDLAAAIAAEVLTGPYFLEATPAVFFHNEGSAEEIWSVLFNERELSHLTFELNVLVGGTDYYISEDIRENGYRQIVTGEQQQALAAAGYQATDLRLTTLTTPDTSTIDKYEDYVQVGDDAPIFRLSEVMLIRAEALAFSKGTNQESIDLLNALRTRSLRVTDAAGNPAPAGPTFISFKTTDFEDTDALIDAIVRERRIELAYEGNYFHDLMRLRRPVKGIPYEADRLRFPIPAREIDANSALEQNPGY